MKKILGILGCLVMVVGCSCSNDKAADAVEKYLNDYKGLNDHVLEDIDELIKNEDLTDLGSETYREVLKRQYRDLIYTIENEDYDGDTATVTVKITVYDLYKAQKDASEYLSEHPDEFLTDGEYDNDLYMEYKLEQMKKTTETVSYNIVFTVTKTDGKWYVEQPSDEVLEKIHGVYNYEED
mgnify:CR=1 FL=1